MIRLLFTVLFLFSTFTHANTGGGGNFGGGGAGGSYPEQVTSPFVYENLPAGGGKVYYSRYDENLTFPSKSALCYGTPHQKIVSPDMYQNFNIKSYHSRSYKDGLCTIKYEKKYGLGFDNRYIFPLEKQLNPTCKKSQLQKHSFKAPPHGTSVCLSNCVYKRKGTTSCNNEGACSFTAESTETSCKLKPFDKGTNPPVNDPPPDTDKDNCPIGKHYSSHFKACVDVVCPKGSTYDNATKKCKPDDPKDPDPQDPKDCPAGKRYSQHFKKCVDVICSKGSTYDPTTKKCKSDTDGTETDPQDPNPEPDKDKPDDQKCPAGYVYNKPTDECLKDNSGNNDCSQVEKDKNGGKCPDTSNPDNPKDPDKDNPKDPDKPKPDVPYPVGEDIEKAGVNADTSMLDKVKNFTVNKNYFQASGSCPADKQLSTRFGNITLSYQPICGFLAKLSYVFLFMAWFTLGFMVIK